VIGDSSFEQGKIVSRRDRGSREELAATTEAQGENKNAAQGGISDG